MMSRQRETKQAERAESLRSEADEQSRLVRQRESKAAEVDAIARAAQAESDAKAAEAQRLSLAAEHQKAEASTQRAEVDDQFRRADEIDPHYDSTGAPGDSARDRTDRSPAQEVSNNDDRDREAPR